MGERAEKCMKKVLFLSKISPESGDVDGGRVFVCPAAFFVLWGEKVGE